jgi:hypothetical protein
MEYYSNWDYEQIDVAPNTKDAINEWNNLRESWMFKGPPQSPTI